MMNPMPSRKAEIYFAKWRPVARANDIRLPAVSVTMIDMTRLPTVACHSELIMNASYSHGAKKPRVTPIPNVAADTVPVAATRMAASITMATNRCPKVAYSTPAVDGITVDGTGDGGTGCACRGLPQP